jgi:3',5'-cyclic AMP phosphodiesterase CpdA
MHTTTEPKLIIKPTFFNIYQVNLTKNHTLWHAPGNHDYAGSAARQADHLIAYYDIFSLPKTGEAGGIASNNEAFYSYNYGNVHFVSLDSYGWETGNSRLYDTTGPQVTWLKRDLAANKLKWSVAYFHHPPYTKGSHNSDVETELIKIRQNLVRILERYKVDLVLNGHSHSYERSYLINGHYDVESTFNFATHALSTSSGKYNGSTNSCPYLKKPAEVRNGIVFALVGSAGKLEGSSSGYPHNSMSYSNVTNAGSLIIEIENNRLDAKWICSDGVIRDNFTIMKEVNKTNNISIAAGSATTLTASWTGNYLWSTGETSKSITVLPSADKIYTVTDNFHCLTDRFNVLVKPKTVIANASFLHHTKP